jgi:beta-glucosidase
LRNILTVTRSTSLTRRSLLATTIAAAPFAAFAAPAAPAYRDARAPTALRVSDLLSRMTLEEKVAQMRCMWMDKKAILDADGNFAPAKAATALTLGIGQIGRPSDTVGSSRITKTTFRTVEDTVALVNGIQRFLVEKTRLGIPALFHEETAHGLAARDATIFPAPPALASTWDPELVEQAFAVAAREGRVRGATVALSPVLDLARDPRFGRVEEFFGEDPYLVGRMGVASVRGQQGPRPLGKDKLFVTLKHFMHGTPEGGLNLAPFDVGERTLRSVFLPPFAEVIGATDPAIVMPSYNEVQGVPAHGSRELLQQTGREELGFKGAYFSDYGGVSMLADGHKMAANKADAAVLALNAGVDADLPDGDSYASLPALVKAGRVSETQIDAAVSRILALKFEAGLFENPYLDARRAVAQTNTSADIKLARKVAEKSIVLLKNDGILPLDPNATLKLAVIGPNGVEPLFGNYSTVNPKAVGVLAGIKAAVGRNISIEQADGVWIVRPEPTGEHRVAQPIRHVPKVDNEKRIAEAVEVAKRADIILLAVGDQPEVTREAISRFSPGDRNSLELFGDQNALVEAMIATGKPIVSLLINGRPLAINRLAEKSNALVEGWYLGQEGGNAVADVLFGKANPGGKLPVSFPRSVGDLPIYYNRHPSSDRNIYIEGERKALFPFGHGLSYTTFELSAPRLAKPQIAVGETAVVEVDVTNTGKRTGDEVVQLYIRDEVSSAPRPVLELRGFQRVTLKAGETRTVRFELTPNHLAFWNIDMKWVVEPGDFTISTGASSAVLKKVKLEVA